MTVEIISWSISTKVWDRTGIELATPGSAVRHASVARHVTDCATRPGDPWSCGKWDKHDCKNSHVVIISFLFTLPYVNLRLKYVWFSGFLTDNPYPPLPFNHFKGFPSSAICPSRVRHGGHFYHLCVRSSWTQLGPEHEINLRGAPDPAGTYDRCD